MKRLIAVAALLSACASSPQAERLPPLERASLTTDAAGNRLEALDQRGDQFCTPDGLWCADSTGEFTHTSSGDSAVVTGATREDETQAVWPYAIRRANGHVLLGITFQTSDMYAGGGAWAKALTLYDVASGANAATAVLSLPYSGSASIRACFDEDDRRARRDACHDEYSFATTIALDGANIGDWPRLVFTTQAQTFPGPRSRSEDSTLAPPLARADLIWAQDEQCSYRRTLTYVEGASGYAPDAPPPDCADYFTQ